MLEWNNKQESTNETLLRKVETAAGLREGEGVSRQIFLNSLFCARMIRKYKISSALLSSRRLVASEKNAKRFISHDLPLSKQCWLSLRVLLFWRNDSCLTLNIDSSILLVMPVKLTDLLFPGLVRPHFLYIGISLPFSSSVVLQFLKTCHLFKNYLTICHQALLPYLSLVYVMYLLQVKKVSRYLLKTFWVLNIPSDLFVTSSLVILWTR